MGHLRNTKRRAADTQHTYLQAFKACRVAPKRARRKNNKKTRRAQQSIMVHGSRFGF